jgi:2-(1,2-epoxy-1,2-dihydrophenyl)acetyl-CoA isomerase
MIAGLRAHTAGMSVHVDVRDRIARITLNRPDTGNALNLELATALRGAAEGLLGSDVGAVIIGGAGKAFCVGGDLNYMHDAADVGEAVLRLATAFHDGLEAFASLDAPVISAVRGAAAGGGMSLAIAADVVLAAESARFTVAYTAIGFPPDGGSSWTLPRLVGPRKATELMLLNERLDAHTALALGLVTRVVPDEQLDDEASALARRLADGPTRAHGAVKRLLRESATRGFTEQMAEEARTIATLSAAPEGREGVAAFLEKRAPRFLM